MSTWSIHVYSISAQQTLPLLQAEVQAAPSPAGLPVLYSAPHSHIKRSVERKTTFSLSQRSEACRREPPGRWSRRRCTKAPIELGLGFSPLAEAGDACLHASRGCQDDRIPCVLVIDSLVRRRRERCWVRQSFGVGSRCWGDWGKGGGKSGCCRDTGGEGKIIPKPPAIGLLHVGLHPNPFNVARSRSSLVCPLYLRPPCAKNSHGLRHGGSRRLERGVRRRPGPF